MTGQDLELQTLGSYKIFVVGPPGVGKTTFIKKHATGDFSSQYTPTTTVQTTPISFRVVDDEGGELEEDAEVDGIVQLDVFDHVNGESWHQADAAIFMFDLSNPNSFVLAMTAFQLYRMLFPINPAVFVGNKHDIANDFLLNEFTWSIVLGTGEDEKKVISSKTNFNYEGPFLYLIRRLLGNDSLEFGVMPVVNPPTVVIPPHLEAQLLQELAVAGVTPLPDLPDIEESEESNISTPSDTIPSLEFSSDLDDYDFSSADEL